MTYVTFINGVRKGAIARVVEKPVSPYGEWIVEWDGRKDPLTVGWWQVKEIPHTGPTVWVYNSVKHDKVIPVDRFEREIRVGDVVSYIQAQNAKSILFGVVSRITKAGSLFVNTIPLADGETGGEARVTTPSRRCVVISEDLMDHLMAARLSR